MFQTRQKFVSDASPLPPEPSVPPPLPSEAEALDPYSRVVVQVSESLQPAVVNLRAGSGHRGGSGSGVLFAPDGFLLTSHHVVQGNSAVRVRLTDGREFDGHVVGADPWT